MKKLLLWITFVCIGILFSLPGKKEPHLLSSCSREELTKVIQAGEEVLAVQKNLNLIAVATENKPTIKKEKHYPKKDHYDPKTRAQYFFHRHRKNETGHFHLYVRPYENSDFVHIGAISIDKRGNPQRLFNLDIEGERIEGEEFATWIDAFVFEEQTPLNCYIMALVRFFKPQLIWLMKEKKRNSFVQIPINIEKQRKISLSLDRQICYQ